MSIYAVNYAVFMRTTVFLTNLSVVGTVRMEQLWQVHQISKQIKQLF